MTEKNIIYSITPLGLLFIPECRAKALAESNQALLCAKTWGEFKKRVSEDLYAYYLVNSAYYQGPANPSPQEIEDYDLPGETPFTPNDVVMYDELPAHPEIEMSEWMPAEIQQKYGRKMPYYAMDMNVPGGDVLVLDEEKIDEIAVALEELGYACRRDDDLLIAATTLDFDAEDYPEVEEG